MDEDGEDYISNIVAVEPKSAARLAWNTRAPILGSEELKKLEEEA